MAPKEKYTESDDLQLMLPILRQLVPRLKKKYRCTAELKKDLAKKNGRPYMLLFILSVLLLTGASGLKFEQTSVLERYKSGQETLYSLLEKDEMDDTFWNDDTNTLYFIRETI